MSNLYFVAYQFSKANGASGVGSVQIEMDNISNVQDIQYISNVIQRSEGYKEVSVTNWRRFEPD